MKNLKNGLLLAAMVLGIAGILITNSAVVGIGAIVALTGIFLK
jgi:hypothetical protein